jgi:hypothetical protein
VGARVCSAGALKSDEEPLAISAAAKDVGEPRELLPRAQLNRARALACAGEHAAAAALLGRLEAAGQLRGQPVAQLCYAAALVGAGEPSQAEAAVLQTLQEDPPAEVRSPLKYPSRSFCRRDLFAGTAPGLHLQLHGSSGILG